MCAKPMTDEERNAYHAEKMKKRKAAQDKKVADKTAQKGLLIVHTGTGKGKSTAAFGMAMRAIAHGLKIGIVQYIKGPWHSGERDVFNKFPDQVEIHAMGEGFTWETQDRARDIATARAAQRITQCAHVGLSIVGSRRRRNERQTHACNGGDVRDASKRHEQDLGWHAESVLRPPGSTLM